MHGPWAQPAREQSGMHWSLSVLQVSVSQALCLPLFLMWASRNLAIIPHRRITLLCSEVRLCHLLLHTWQWLWRDFVEKKNAWRRTVMIQELRKSFTIIFKCNLSSAIEMAKFLLRLYWDMPMCSASWLIWFTLCSQHRLQNSQTFARDSIINYKVKPWT